MYKYVKKKRNTKSDSYTCPLQVTAMYVKIQPQYLLIMLFRQRPVVLNYMSALFNVRRMFSME